MDQKNKADQFFREKLDQIEFQPSEQAWEKIQEGIGSKEATPWATYLKVAAGVALILTVGILFYPTETSEVYTDGEVISPQPLELAFLDIQDAERSKTDADRSKTEEFSQAPNAEASSNQEIEEAPNQPNNQVIENARVPLDLQIIDDIMIADAEIPVNVPDLKGEAKGEGVKITYYTGRSGVESEPEINEEDSVKTNLIDKVRFFARTVSPVELITDLRTAKEELIENGFRKN